jgi:hypothetical protein
MLHTSPMPVRTQPMVLRGWRRSTSRPVSGKARRTTMKPTPWATDDAEIPWSNSASTPAQQTAAGNSHHAAEASARSVVSDREVTVAPKG